MKQTKRENSLVKDASVLFRKVLIASSALLSLETAFAGDKISYFSCKVSEKDSKNKKIEVTVKFAVKNLDFYKEDTGELLSYPGMNEEEGAISVTPVWTGKENDSRMTLMSNLNSQGGDFSVEGDDVVLFGDGDGYQLTDLVIWDVGNSEEEEDSLEGYVRDYGSAYADGKSKTFKQFIVCKRSAKKL